ncbi:hypothetical protein J6590_048657 [Homalodisca vitripennis]|nr:hypothetical protein J6590_048657 [Homalodisca vitripennis]
MNPRVITAQDDLISRTRDFVTRTSNNVLVHFPLYRLQTATGNVEHGLSDPVLARSSLARRKNSVPSTVHDEKPLSSVPSQHDFHTNITHSTRQISGESIHFLLKLNIVARRPRFDSENSVVFNIKCYIQNKAIERVSIADRLVLHHDRHITSGLSPATPNTVNLCS